MQAQRAHVRAATLLRQLSTAAKPQEFDVSDQQIADATKVVRACFPVTQVIFAPRLSKKLNCNLYLKLDHTTPTRTFKVQCFSSSEAVEFQAMAAASRLAAH